MANTLAIRQWEQPQVENVPTQQQQQQQQQQFQSTNNAQQQVSAQNRLAPGQFQGENIRPALQKFPGNDRSAQQRPCRIFTPKKM